MWYVPDGPKPLVAVTAAAVIVAGLGIAGAVATHERVITGTAVTECTASGKTQTQCAMDDGFELVADIVDISQLRASVSPVQTPEANLSNFRTVYCRIAAGRDMDLVLLGQGSSFRDIAHDDYERHVADGRLSTEPGKFSEEVADTCP